MQHRPDAPRLILIGDVVARVLGTGDAKYGRVIAKEDGSANRWLICAGGRIYRECAADLHVVRRLNPWPASLQV